jgi:glycerophosphoryl diester phosphodiesterase
MLSNLPKPAIIAHRGSSAYAPENTLAAFKLALQQGADGIELDAKLTKDGQIAVIHDQTVDRTTPLRGRVKDFSMAELHRMDAGSHFDIAFQGEPIPSLEEVLKAVGQLTFTNIELTNYYAPFDNLPEKTAELVKQLKLSQRVMFSSFSIIALSRIHRLLPDVPVGFLLPSGWRGKFYRSLLGGLVHHESLHPEQSDVSEALVSTTHRKGRKIFVYTVNAEADIQRMATIGVDGFFTDNPLLARSILESKQRSISRND